MLLPILSRPLIIVELVVLFLLVPLAVWKQWLPVPLITIPLYVLVAYALVWLLGRRRQNVKQLWFGESVSLEKAALKLIAIRFIFVIASSWLVIHLLYPEKLFVLPAEHPVIWLLIIVLYPPLSVVPQEILYRSFFFARYAGLFPAKKTMVIANTLCFVFMHIVFGNAVAIVGTLIGGYFFADTYSRTQSLRLVSLEHSLYGIIIFTLGLGEFFVFGVAKSFIQ
jgi:hypothetical protein